MKKLFFLFIAIITLATTQAQRKVTVTGDRYIIRDSMQLGGVWRSTWPDGSSGIGTAWQVGGNTLGATTGKLGTLDNQPLMFYAFNRNNLTLGTTDSMKVTVNSVIAADDSSNQAATTAWIRANILRRYFFKEPLALVADTVTCDSCGGSGGGSTPTWQQTLTAGSVLASNVSITSASGVTYNQVHSGSFGNNTVNYSSQFGTGITKVNAAGTETGRITVGAGSVGASAFTSGGASSYITVTPTSALLQSNDAGVNYCSVSVPSNVGSGAIQVSTQDGLRYTLPRSVPANGARLQATDTAGILQWVTDSLRIGNDWFFTKKITLTPAQVFTLNSVPVLAINSPGVGKAVELLSVTGRLVFNSVSYVEDATISVRNITDNVNVFDGMSTFAESNLSTLFVPAPGANSYKENTSLYLYASSDNTTGDSNIYFTFYYKINTF